MKKVNKKIAKKLYNQGHNVYVVPCKVRFDFNAIWFKPTLITHDFDLFMNEYSFYNLNNELGTYAHYYIES